ncbi:MAG: hypothetical protein HQL62_05370, partial [Magnetococcales bacterium]|nr:hypothetical protein [Magnetococcales bacterium]
SGFCSRLDQLGQRRTPPENLEALIAYGDWRRRAQEELERRVTEILQSQDVETLDIPIFNLQTVRLWVRTGVRTNPAGCVPGCVPRTLPVRTQMTLEHFVFPSQIQELCVLRT